MLWKARGVIEVPKRDKQERSGYTESCSERRLRPSPMTPSNQDQSDRGQWEDEDPDGHHPEYRKREKAKTEGPVNEG